MPRKKKLKRRWYTIAFFTREGEPHPAHASDNFARWYRDEPMLLKDLTSIMTSWSRGAYAAAAWVGELSQYDCLQGTQKPAFYVYGDGKIDRLKDQKKG